jgi:hypothetical protein
MRALSARIEQSHLGSATTLSIMSERVEPYDLFLGEPLRWDPNVPEAFFVSDDRGRGALAQRAHPDDPDQRCVVLRWDVVHYALMSPPNDEGRHLHRLYEVGLKDVDWLGLVRDSNLLEGLRPALGPGVMFEPLHYVVVSKECVVEVLAENVNVFRIDGGTRQAAPASLSPE